MKWVPDSTGRFQWRPYYDQAELDYECERLVTIFLKRRYGEIHFPLSTDDISVMIEQETSYLDVYADLSVEGPDVEGLTEFFPNKKPAVRIARGLSLDSRRSGRLRTTLAHEFGHVRFHTFLWELSPPNQQSTTGVLSQVPIQRRKYAQFRERIARRYAPEKAHLSNQDSMWARLSTDGRTGMALKCRRSQVLDAPYSDWMEWQASYACGAILMPLSFIRNFACAEIRQSGSHGWLTRDSDAARELIAHVATSFDVPLDSARVRLEKLGFLQNIQPSPVLSDFAPK